MSTKSRIAALIGLTGIFSVTPAAFAEAKTFEIRNDGGSRIQFLSDAPLETINGVSTRITGSITVDAANLREARGSLTAQTAALRTGVDLRDEHLRSETWLDSRRYPDATFELAGVEGPMALRPNEPTELRVRGRFTLHGVTRNVVATARVRYLPITDEMRQTPGITGDVLRVSATFSILLSDYRVSVPAIVRLKVSNEIRVNVSLRGISRS